MNIFDICIVLLILMSGLSGLKQGVLKSGVNLVGTVVIYIVSFALKSKIGILLCKIFPFFEFDGLTTINILIYQLIAFVLIASVLFSLFTIVMKLTGVVQKLVDLTIILTLPSKILGLIVGLLEGYIVMFIILVVLSIPLRDVSTFTSSKVADAMINKSPILSSSLGGIKDSLADVLVITVEIEDGNMDKNKVNLDIMKKYLDCKVISKEDAMELLETKKLDDIKGIHELIKSY